MRKFQLWCVLLLATVLGHALLPIGTPAARQSGSPFSASTIEVSTVPGRRLAAVQQVRTEPDPDDRGTSLPLFAILLARDETSVRLGRQDPISTGNVLPPPLSLARHAPPTAPPHA